MPTRTIGSAGRQHTNPETWSAARLNGITPTEDEIGEMYNDTPFTGRYDIGNMNPGTSFTWTLRSATGQASTTWGAGVRIAPTSGSGHLITLVSDAGDDLGCRFGSPDQGFELVLPPTSATSDECFRATGALELTLDSLCCRANSFAGGLDGMYAVETDAGSTYEWHVCNCKFYDLSRGGVHYQFNSTGVTQTANLLVTSCVFDSCGSPLQWRTRNAGHVLNYTIKNCIASRSSELLDIIASTSTFNLSLAVDGDHNFTPSTGLVTVGADRSFPDDAGNTLFNGDTTATDPGAAGNWYVVTSLANPPDLRPQNIANNDVLAAGFGTNDTDITALDIEGRARPATQSDMGPYEETPGAGGPVEGEFTSSHATTLTFTGLRGHQGRFGILHETEATFDGQTAGTVEGAVNVLHETLATFTGQRGLVSGVGMLHETTFQGSYSLGIRAGMSSLHETLATFTGRRGLRGLLLVDADQVLTFDGQTSGDVLGAFTVSHATTATFTGLRGHEGRFGILHATEATFDGDVLAVVQGALDVLHETTAQFTGQRGLVGLLLIDAEQTAGFTAVQTIAASFAISHSQVALFAANAPEAPDSVLGAPRVELSVAEPLRVEVSALEPLRVELQS